MRFMDKGTADFLPQRTSNGSTLLLLLARTSYVLLDCCSEKYLLA